MTVLAAATLAANRPCSQSRARVLHKFVHDDYQCQSCRGNFVDCCWDEVCKTWRGQRGYKKCFWQHFWRDLH